VRYRLGSIAFEDSVWNKKSFFNEENIRPNGIIRMGAVGIQQKSEL
jgi:hypothetical protein